MTKFNKRSEAKKKKMKLLLCVLLYPKMLKLGFMLEVVFLPRVSVTRACAPSRIPLAAKVVKIAVVTSAEDGTDSKASALAESCNLRKCLFKIGCRPRHECLMKVRRK